MEAYLNKCSICFEADSELELGLCGDQFCFACLEAWLRFQLQRAWGIRPIELGCPVCRQEVEEEDWAPWVSRPLFEEYLEMQERSRDLIRQCSQCGHQQAMAGPMRLQGLATLLNQRLPPSPLQQRLIRLASLGAYHSLLEVLAQSSEACATVELNILLCRAILHEAPQARSSLQLAMLRLLPQSLCDACSSPLCMRCSAPSWHLGKPCTPPADLPPGW